MEKKLDKEKIIKGLECCKTSTPIDCRKCPYKNQTTPEYVGCCNLLVADALALINEFTETVKNTANEIIDEVARIIAYSTYPHIDMDGKFYKIWNALLGEELLEKLKERYRNDKNK